jgi:hypothetical protein
VPEGYFDKLVTMRRAQKNAAVKGRQSNNGAFIAVGDSAAAVGGARDCEPSDISLHNLAGNTV